MLFLKKLHIVRQLKKQFYQWDPETLKNHQETRVKEILSFAGNYSAFYKDIISPESSLEDISLMNKSIMMENFDEINTVGLKRDKLIKYNIEQEKSGSIKLYNSKYSIGLSSGTSGSRGLTILGKNERDMYGCLIWARNGLPEHIKKYRILFALRTNNPSYMEPRSFGAKMVYVDYTHPPEKLIELINLRKLNIIAGPPSLLSMLGSLQSKIKHKIDALISYAEVLDEKNKQYLEIVFGVPVVQIYQGSEGFIGSTCRHGNLHINEDTVLVQLNELDFAGGASKVILTDLYRTSQPVIRYELNDVLEISSEPCTCGSCFRVIKLIHGRADDLFLLNSYDNSTRYLFPDYVRRAINQASGDILEYQAIQHSLDLVEIRLVLKPGCQENIIEDKIRENLKRRASTSGGQLGKIIFTDKKPELNSNSKKLIRIIRNF